MKLTENWRVEQRSDDNFFLIHECDGEDKNGNPKKHDNTYFYGTLYQALQGFMLKNSQDNTDSLEDLNFKISHTLSLLEVAKDHIKKEFKLEVKVMR